MIIEYIKTWICVSSFTSILKYIKIDYEKSQTIWGKLKLLFISRTFLNMISKSEKMHFTFLKSQFLGSYCHLHLLIYDD